jgi:RNA polymerase sigma factor (TIGR02999 family)
VPDDPRDITLLLRELKQGGRDAFDQVLTLIYEELRGLADQHLKRERASHTLQPTALVHEAFLRMVGQDAGFESRLQFLRVASTMMRRVLVDHARSHGRRKRGGDAHRVELTESVAAEPEASVDLIELDDALKKLEALDPRKVRIIELRYFAGMTIEETARLLEISPATISRDWDVARLWLLREIHGNPRAE